MRWCARVEELTDAVIASEVPVKRLVKECIAATEDLIHKRVTLRLLVSGVPGRGLVGKEERERISEVLAIELPQMPGLPQYQDWTQHPRGQQWQQAREQLMRDADAKFGFQVQGVCQAGATLGSRRGARAVSGRISGECRRSAKPPHARSRLKLQLPGSRQLP